MSTQSPAGGAQDPWKLAYQAAMDVKDNPSDPADTLFRRVDAAIGAYLTSAKPEPSRIAEDVAWLRTQAVGAAKAMTMLQGHRTADYKARGDLDANYKGIEAHETREWEIANYITAIEAENAEIKVDLAKQREKFTMHTAHVGAWLSAAAQELGLGKDGDNLDVATVCTQIMDRVQAAKSAEADRDRMREALEEAAAFISGVVAREERDRDTPWKSGEELIDRLRAALNPSKPGEG